MGEDVHVEDLEVVDHPITGLALGDGQPLGAGVAVEFTEIIGISPIDRACIDAIVDVV